MNTRFLRRSIKANFILTGPIHRPTTSMRFDRRLTQLNCTIMSLIIGSAATFGWEGVRLSCCCAAGGTEETGEE